MCRGEHNATQIGFALPATLRTGYKLYLEALDGRGGYDRTSALTLTDGAVYTCLPREWTQAGGELTLRLVAKAVAADGTVTETVYTFEVRLRLRDRNIPENGVTPLLEQELQNAIAAGEQAKQAATTATEKAATATEKAKAAADSAAAAADSEAKAKGHGAGAQEAWMGATQASEEAEAAAAEADKSEAAAKAAAATATEKATSAAASATAAAGSEANATKKAAAAAVSATEATKMRNATEAAAMGAAASKTAAAASEAAFRRPQSQKKQAGSRPHQGGGCLFAFHPLPGMAFHDRFFGAFRSGLRLRPHFRGDGILISIPILAVFVIPIFNIGIVVY